MSTRRSRQAAAAHADGRWRDLPPEERARVLIRIADLIEERLEDLAVLETRDNGKPIERSRAGHRDERPRLPPLLWRADRIAGKTSRSPATTSTPSREPVGCRRPRPAPGPSPIMTACFKLAPALAAGCTVVLKPAEQTPMTTLRVAAICEEAGVPPGRRQRADRRRCGRRAAGRPPGRAERLLHHRSTEVGRLVMSAAAPTTKRLTLELGGKSPNIVFADADLDLATAPRCAPPSATRARCARRGAAS